MTAYAKVDTAPFARGVRIRLCPTETTCRLWETFPMSALLSEGAEPEVSEGHVDYFQIGDDEARALYEALAEHFGHAGHDIRALRKDYDAERKRVDHFIAHLTGGNQ